MERLYRLYTDLDLLPKIWYSSFFALPHSKNILTKGNKHLLQLPQTVTN